MGSYLLFGGLLVFLVFLLAGIRMVGSAGRGLVERLGKYWRLAMPGLKGIPRVDDCSWRS